MTPSYFLTMQVPQFVWYLLQLVVQNKVYPTPRCLHLRNHLSQSNKTNTSIKYIPFTTRILKMTTNQACLRSFWWHVQCGHLSDLQSFLVWEQSSALRTSTLVSVMFFFSCNSVVGLLAYILPCEYPQRKKSGLRWAQVWKIGQPLNRGSATDDPALEPLFESLEADIWGMS